MASITPQDSFASRDKSAIRFSLLAEDFLGERATRREKWRDSAR